MTVTRTWTRSSRTAPKSARQVEVTAEGAVMTITIARPEVRNAVDPATASALKQAFEADKDRSFAVAVLTGAGEHFCAGFDLKALAAGSPNPPAKAGDGPMGPTRMVLNKPVIAAIEGYAVAGGLELALWCDLRVAAGNATLGVFNRRFGVPLIDLGTIRLPRMIGQGRALDLILTGRAVPAIEALQIGLVERLVEPGRALETAQLLARQIAALPQGALRADRRSVLTQW
ncbi:MAG TPA: crotonase/enoyl-CoA hydratase family protein, partial [Candidatus Acidoferrum sp.]|nr:crotonase/enoyl-CoA hydratase family protein [Candidatus Acidoferrum sp.]